MLDRTQQPQINEFKNFKMARATTYTLDNGIKLYLLNQGEEEVVRIDWMIRAGSCYQSQKLTAHFANSLIKEGCRTLNSAEIAEQLDFYGSWLHLTNSHQYAYVTLYALNRHLPTILALAEEMIFHATLPEKEFATLKEILRKKMEIDQTKVDYLSNRQFKEIIYGADHLYGKNAKIEDIDKLDLAQIRQFYQTHYNTRNTQIFVAGKITPEVEKTLLAAFNKIEATGEPLEGYVSQEPQPAQEKRFFIEKADSVQSSVIIGKPMVNRKHPDHTKLNVLNTVLGGYFGSRLMTNIREEKGYTYGINSYLVTYPEFGHFKISSQTGNEFTQPLIEEVFHEIEKLRTELIPQEELDMVKMYLLGEHLRTIDSGLNLVDLLISLVGHKQSYDYYDKMAEEIKETTSEELLELAQKYLDPSNFFVVVAGAKSK